MMDDENSIPEEEMMMREEGTGHADRPDAYEFRLLLSEEIAKTVEWAFNAFLENEITRRSRARVGFCASRPDAAVPSARTVQGGRGNAIQKFHRQRHARAIRCHSFVIGPAFAYKPTARMRFDVSPLFGVTDDSPDVQIFAVFSYVFGGGGERSRSARFDPNR